MMLTCFCLFVVMEATTFESRCHMENVMFSEFQELCFDCRSQCVCVCVCFDWERQWCQTSMWLSVQPWVTPSDVLTSLALIGRSFGWLEFTWASALVRCAHYTFSYTLHLHSACFPYFLASVEGISCCVSRSFVDSAGRMVAGVNNWSGSGFPCALVGFAYAGARRSVWMRGHLCVPSELPRGGDLLEGPVGVALSGFLAVCWAWRCRTFPLASGWVWHKLLDSWTQSITNALISC